MSITGIRTEIDISFVEEHAWTSPRLQYATPEERAYFERYGDDWLHWPNLNEDMSIQRMIDGSGSKEKPHSVAKWKLAIDEYRALPDKQGMTFEEWDLRRRGCWRD